MTHHSNLQAAATTLASIATTAAEQAAVVALSSLVFVEVHELDAPREANADVRVQILRDERDSRRKTANQLRIQLRGIKDPVRAARLRFLAAEHEGVVDALDAAIGAMELVERAKVAKASRKAA